MLGPVARWLRTTCHAPIAPGVESPAQQEPVEVVVVSTESMYADPAYADLEQLAGTTDRWVGFGSDGPIVGITSQALDAAMFHAGRHLQHEVGGLCLGSVFKQRSDDRLLIRIEQTLQAEHTIAGAAFVTFTFETWNQLINTQRRRYPELRLLGWYHSHPGFGIFLSSMDRFIHQGFFVMPWHVALVVDPVKNQVGIFARGPLDILPPDVFDWAERPCPAQSPAGDLPSAIEQP